MLECLKSPFNEVRSSDSEAFTGDPVVVSTTDSLVQIPTRDLCRFLKAPKRDLVWSRLGLLNQSKSERLRQGPAIKIVQIINNRSHLGNLIKQFTWDVGSVVG